MGWRMSCDLGDVTERLENELCHSGHSVDRKFLICLDVLRFVQMLKREWGAESYVTAHSPTLPSLYLSHSSFSNTSVASPTSQFILQPFFRFYVTSSSLNSPGEPPMGYIRVYSFSRFSCNCPMWIKRLHKVGAPKEFRRFFWNKCDKIKPRNSEWVIGKYNSVCWI